ncbi:MAG TPA: hypothetical protein VIP08_16800 [Phenylobacterium sp.]|uniref:hypothetical protein n=1 Tax=Phenylobacterium sp. TaxID=1871053 RepID=UPI002F95DA74
MGSATYEITFKDDEESEAEVIRAAKMARAKVCGNKVDRTAGIRTMQVRMSRHSDEVLRRLFIHRTSDEWRRVK